MNREDLKNYKYSQKWVEEQLNYFEEQRTRVLRITQILSDMPKAQNKPNDVQEELMDSINEFINDFTLQQQELNKVIEQLNKLTPLFRKILFDIYILNMNLEETALDVHYSYNKTCTFHGRALEEFDKIG